MIRVGIVGISGYTGKEVYDLCAKHPQVRVTYVSANTTTGQLDSIWPDLKGTTTLKCLPYNVADACEHCDLVFLALPHTQSMLAAPALLDAGLKVIDLSGDFRLSKVATYEKWYEVKHQHPALLRSAVYGMPELFRTKIKKAHLIANPGCYPTAAILGLAPLMTAYAKEVQSIVIDAKSGYSGAGKKVAESLMVGEVDQNFYAYKALNHRHAPEIEEYVSKVASAKMNITFVPHLLPIARGIQESIYIHCHKVPSQAQLQTLYKKFYKTEPFVRVYDAGVQPQIKNVVHSNFCDIGITVSREKKCVVITSVIDNLVKGAAGQAVHNMNIMCGFDEKEGLL